MNKQRALVALDWLMPVLQDAFVELRQLLEQAPVVWLTVVEQLHQIHEALILTNQPLLSQLASKLEQTARAIDEQCLALNHRGDMVQGVMLLQHETLQLQCTQRFNRQWVIERINAFHDLLGDTSAIEPTIEPTIESDDAPNAGAAATKTDSLSLINVPLAQVDQSLSDMQQQQLVVIWRYCTLQLLKQQHNDPHTLGQLASVVNYLARTPVDLAYRKVWHLVALLCDSLMLNDTPKPAQYTLMLNRLESLLHATSSVPKIEVAQLAVDVLVQLSELAHKTLPVQNLLATLDIEHQVGLDSFAYAKDPQQEAIRCTRIHLENIKLAFNSYNQSHQISDLTVNDDFVSMIQVFGMLGLSRPQELIEQLRLLFRRLNNQQIKLLSWDAIDAIAEMIARFELFLDCLSHQSNCEDLLDESQTLLNRVDLLLNQTVDTSTSQPVSRKRFESNTLVYDDEGEKPINTDPMPNSLVMANPAATQDNHTDESPLVQEVNPTEQTDLGESAALLAARASLKPDNYSMDDDIQQIFIEETEEVLAQMDTDLPRWQADPSDLDALKEVRRGFHTLKGSGRMVGAFQVAEMSWAVENMLNHVLDGTVPVTDALVTFINDTRHTIPILVADYAAQRAPSIDPARTVLQANNLLAQLPIDTDLPPLPTMSITSTANTTTAAPVLSDADKAKADATVAAVTTQHDSSNKQTDKLAPPPTVMPATASVAPVAQSVKLPVILPEAVQDAYDQLPDVKDAPTDPEIQAIYVEEAQEVLETIEPLYAIWQADPSDTATLKDLRRGFHTLKGSGRMVGAHQLGELAWSIENMLNRVLDNTIDPDAGLVTLVGDVIAKFPELIDSFAKNHGDYPDTIQLWSAVAHAYAKKQGDRFVYPAFMHADHSTNSDDTVTQSQQQVVTDSPSLAQLTEQQALDDSLDKSLDTVFIEEACEILAVIEAFIATHRDKEYAFVSNNLVRAFHTLRGGAAILNLTFMCDLSKTLEESLGELLRHDIPLTQQQLGLVASVKDTLQQFLQNYSPESPESPESLATLAVRPSDSGQDSENSDKEALNAIKTQLLAGLHSSATASQLSVQNYLDLGIDDLLDAGDVLEYQLAQPAHEVSAYASLLAAQATKLAHASLDKRYASLTDTLEYSYRTLEQYPEIAKDPEVIEALLGLHDQLIAMLDAIAAGLNVVVNEDSLQHTRQLLSDKIDQANEMVESKPNVPSIVETGHNASQQIFDNTKNDSTSVEPIVDPLSIQKTLHNIEQRRLKSWQGQDPDQDILGVFLEEAKELVESSSQYLQEFRANTNNLAALHALQRELHTIKGGARMVGAEGLANLAHEMENVYEQLVARRKPSTQMVSKLLAACHDWLASSLYVLENRYNPQIPEPLIQALQDFLNNPDSLKMVPNVTLAKQVEQIEMYKAISMIGAGERYTRDLSVMPEMTGNFAREQEQVNLNAEMLRISAGLMEQMINLSGESAINRARIEMGISSLSHTIEEMGVTVQRLADQLRRMETELEIQILAQIGDEQGTNNGFDPLEMDQYSALNQLSKSLSESASDLLDIKTTMLDQTRDTENLLLQLSRTQAEL